MDVWNDIKLNKQDFMLYCHASDTNISIWITDLKQLWGCHMTKNEFDQQVRDFHHLVEFILPSFFESHLLEDILNPENYEEQEDKIYLQSMTSIPELCPVFRMESYHFVF